MEGLRGMWRLGAALYKQLKDKCVLQQTILRKNGLATHPAVKRQFAGADVSDGLQELCAKMSRSETSLFVELSSEK